MLSLLALAIIFARPAHAAIDNLNCEIHLAGEPYVVADGVPPITLGPERIAVRGQLHYEIDEERRLGRWAVRDVEGTEKIFRDEADALFNVERGDYLYLLDERGGVFRHGYFDLIPRASSLIVRGEPRTIERSPQIFKLPNAETPVLASEALCTLFMTAKDAVLVKACSDAERARLSARLQPQIDAYHAYIADPANPRRFVTLGDRKIELAIFDEKLEGPLHYTFVNAAGRVEGLTTPDDDGVVRMVAWVIDRGRRRVLRAKDRVILLDSCDAVLAEYVVRRVPIELALPARHPRDQQLLHALGTRRRAVVIRRERP